MRVNKEPIPADVYRDILAAVPLPCVDLVIVYRGKFLLGKRKNKPAQGQWFLIGGRILRGELLEEAVARHATGAGLNGFRIKKQLGARETIFKNSAHGVPSHTVNVAYLVEIFSKQMSDRIGDNTSVRWFADIDDRWHPYVKEMLGRAGFE